MGGGGGVPHPHPHPRAQTHSWDGRAPAAKPGGRCARQAHTELLFTIIPQEEQLWVEGHLTEVLGCLTPGFLFFLSPRRRRFGQKPIFLLEAKQEMRTVTWNC